MSLTRAARRLSSQVPQAHRRARRALFEALEERRLLSTFHWKNAADGDFNTAANRQENAVLGQNDDAIVGFSEITVSAAANAKVNTLTMNNPRLSLSGGTFTIQNGAGNSTIN